MNFLSNTSKIAIILASLLSISAGNGKVALAETAQNRTLLENLAKNFVQKLSPIYSDNQTTKKEKQLSSIPDGTTLLLKPRVDRVVYFGDIYAIKVRNEMFLSIVDVIDVLELAIDYDAETRIGSGWFLQESWKANIDLANKKVTTRGTEYNVLDSDLYEDSGVLFIKGSTISEWFDFDFEYDTAQQYITVNSDFPLPAIAKNERRERKSSLGRKENKAKLPRLEQAEKFFDLDTVDVNLRSQYRKTGNSGTTSRRHSANVGVQGQFLKHDTYAFANTDNDEGLRSIRARFSKQSEDPELLGPLKARFYQLGDVSGTTVPLTGTNEQALGFRINNNPLVNSNFNTTDIDGDSIPGWDIELYRNSIVVGSQIIGEDGRYNFNDVQLFAGDNDFELVFYGPQGEIRKEFISIPVTADLLKTQEDTYEMSVQLQERGTYQKIDSGDVDKNQVNIAARYNKFLGNSLGYIGARSNSVNGERRSYASSGVTSVLNGTLYDANFAIDDKANTAIELGARRNLMGWDTALNTRWNTDEYSTSGSSDPSILNVNASARRSFMLPTGKKANTELTSTYQETATGNTSLVSQLGLSTQIKRLSLSNNLRHETRDNSESGSEDALDNSFSVRTGIGKTYIRGGIDYEIKPKAEVERYFSQVNYRHDNRKSADLTLEHRPQNNFSRGRLNVNYTNKYFRTSPFVELNSNDDVFAGMNINFNLIDAPPDMLPIVTSERTIGRGLVSAFVYHDKNGNFIYDGDDEILPEVVVESVNSRKRATTDQDGYALLKGVSTAIPTDIVIDEDTLPDSFMISGFEGASVFPIAGQTYNFVFPIHLAGEIDGTMYIQDEFGDTKLYANKAVRLLSLDNAKRDAIETQAMFDGFFLFSKVPPGRYLMLPKKSNIRKDLGNPLPQVIDIGYDGDTFFDRKIILRKNQGFANYKVSFEENNDNAGSNTTRYQLEVKQNGKSQLSKLLSLLSFKNYAAPVLKNLNEIPSENENLKIYSGSQKQLHEACSRLDSRDIECTINVIVSTKPAAKG